ncbi:hypothetical protein GJ688_02015 [Heliobacillus mobilis]|uniref:Uncharacterized protein n=1 Tax=Heliobacterium mobile TaxID=28064 RepID=A0A6I3SBN4_HELMO|nr:hypothetical protein [Heliobacterium mobile]MTV47758.1 hypothetical protein [Heliobacterium mobile]
MIRAYLNQKAIWRQVTGKDINNDPKTEDKEIAVRWEGRRRLVRDKRGQEVVSEARVYCLEPVQPGDFLIWQGVDWPVIAVSEVPGLGGKVSHREVAV